MQNSTGLNVLYLSHYRLFHQLPTSTLEKKKNHKNLGHSIQEMCVSIYMPLKNFTGACVHGNLIGNFHKIMFRVKKKYCVFLNKIFPCTLFSTRKDTSKGTLSHINLFTGDDTRGSGCRFRSY